MSLPSNQLVTKVEGKLKSIFNKHPFMRVKGVVGTYDNVEKGAFSVSLSTTRYEWMSDKPNVPDIQFYDDTLSIALAEKNFVILSIRVITSPLFGTEHFRVQALIRV